MSKKRDGGSVKVKITDDGSLKNLGKNAKKAGKDVGSVAKNVQESDRRLKSLSQQTSNTTKAFSKQAQTIGGGLVPIYATIAAQVFAVSAAFRFLQDAMEIRNMIEGQKAFGSVTGQAFGTMTLAVQQATANMLTFKEAASSVAIGVASGLSRGQLEGLGTAAKNASLALGRDLTDSFNRLIRGVTKAEPELLDELGIILRLEPATEKYALSIGKTRQELNAFERSQAVANEVLEQAERKFGAINQIMDPDAFALAQFAKEFDDFTKEIKEQIIEGIIPIVNFLKDNLMGLIGVFGLLAAPIVSQILPTAALDDFAAASKRTAESSRTMAKNLKKDAKLIENLRKGGTLGAEGRKQFTASGQAGIQGMLSGMDMSGESKTMQKAAMGKKLNAQELGVLKRHLKQKGHLLNKFNAEERAKFDRYIKHQELGLKGSMTKAKLEYKQLGIATNVYIQKAKAGFRGLFATIASGASMAGKALSKLMGAFGWISLIVMAVGAIREFFKEEEKGLTAFQERMKETTDVLDKLNTELARMKAVSDLGLLGSSTSAVQQVANALKSTDVIKLIGDYNEAVRGGADDAVIDRFRSVAESLAQLSPSMAGLQGLFSGEIVEKDMAKPFIELANGIMAIGMALDQMPEQLQGVSKALQGLISGAPTSKFTPLRKAIRAITDEDSGAMGKGAFEAREAANADMTAINQRMGFRAFASGAANTLGDQGDYKKFDHHNMRLRSAAILGQADEITKLGSSQLGLDTINAALQPDESFTNQRDIERYFQNLRKGEGLERENTRGAVEKVLEELVASGLVKGFENDAVVKKFDDATTQMAIDKSTDLDAINSDKENAKVLLKIDTEITKNIKEETRIRESNLQLKLDSLDASVLVNREDKVAAETRIKLSQKANNLATSQNELEAAKLIANQTYAEQNGLVLEDLEKQRDVAQEKVDLAQKELDIQKELIMTALNRSQEKINNAQARLEMGSFGNSFFNKQRDFVLGNRDDITAKGALAEQEALKAGVSEGDAARFKEDVIRAQTEAYMAQAVELEKINGMLKLQEGISNRLTDGLANDMAGALVDVAKGTKTLKQAFGDMAISIIADITKMIIKQLILNMLMAMVGMINPGAGAALSSFLGGTGAREGGIMQPGGRGGYRSYRSGGVADGPEAGYQATLHGTEAVVPLGDDREIPVKMLNGGGGSTNNVNVSVNVSDSGTDVKMEGDKAKAFGTSIAAAVQQEIVKQQRAGGLLSSY